jgi:formylglycine-generating enzyme required for sulfatase activity
LGATTPRCSDAAAAGIVIEQSPPAGSVAAVGSAVSLVVSSGACPKDVIVPDVRNQTQQAASTVLSDVGLSAGAISRQCSDSVAQGFVIAQNPAANGAAPPGTAVNLTVSTGACPVASIEPVMVRLPGGTFLMGSPDSEAERYSDETQHPVTVNSFSIGQYEVTQGQWQAVMGSNPSYFSSCGDDCPVETVSWDEVQVYIGKLNQMTGKRYRLPTEAEWEYAARGGTNTPFYTGNCISTAQANYDGNYDYNGCGANTGVYLDKTVRVGSYPANPFGLYDMAGNVGEWTCSDYADPYDGHELTSNNSANNLRAIRGGSWFTQPEGARSADRNDFDATNRDDGVGFRLAQD